MNRELNKNDLNSELNLIERIRSKTPKKDKTIGQITTAIGTACAIVLLTVEIPDIKVKITLLVLSLAFGGESLRRAQKVKR